MTISLCTQYQDIDRRKVTSQPRQDSEAILYQPILPSFAVQGARQTERLPAACITGMMILLLALPHNLARRIPENGKM